MKKQVFTVEIIASKKVFDTDFECVVRRGLTQYYGDVSEFSYSVSRIENNVEQNVERSKDQDKMVDLLNRASERLHDYAIDFTSGNSDSLATQIDEFLDGKQ